MKLTKETLKQIIKEELKAVMEGSSEDYFSKERDERAAKEQEELRKQAQNSRIRDNERFVNADIQADKQASSIYKRNRDEVYDLVMKQVSELPLVRSALGEGKVTKDAVHELINKSIDDAGGIRVGDKNVEYFNLLLQLACFEEIDDFIGKSSGPAKLRIVKELARGEQNESFAYRVFTYIVPVLSKYLRNNRSFMQKAGSFLTGKGFREE
jgi:hypothetical protein